MEEDLKQHEKSYEWNQMAISYAIYRLNRLGRYVHNLFNPQIKSHETIQRSKSKRDYSG